MTLANVRACLKHTVTVMESAMQHKLGHFVYSWLPFPESQVVFFPFYRRGYV